MASKNINIDLKNIDLKALLRGLLGLVKKLGFFKNNLALLVPIIIAFVALLLFVPTTLLSGALRAKITAQSVQPSSQIDAATKNLAETADAQALTAYIDAYQQDANAMDAMILHSTERELLSYKLFPDMNETSPLLFEPFRQRFVSGVDAMFQNLKAGSPPTDTEILTALDSSPARSRFGGRARQSATSTMAGSRSGRLNLRMMSDADRKIVTMVCEDRAKTIQLFANQSDIGGYLYWTDWKFEDWDKAVKDSWFWQMAYWILEDVTATIGQMNQGSENVLRAPVKRLEGVVFVQGRAGRSAIGGRMRRVANVARDKQTPMYVMNVKTSMTGTPCTGRFSNATYDVMQFEVRVVVNAADVMRFMKDLCSAKTHKFRGWRGDEPEQTFKHNQITILETQVTPVDREDPDHSMYAYGPEEVVDVDLVCEYVFNKAAYAKIQPKAVLDDMEKANAPNRR